MIGVDLPTGLANVLDQTEMKTIGGSLSHAFITENGFQSRNTDFAEELINPSPFV